MEGINHAGHGAARPQNPALPFFGIDNDSQMMSDDFSFGSPFSPTDSNNNDNFLQDPIFPEWKTGAPRGGDNPHDLQKQDPLAAQIWRLYTRTKSQLPNQERMENLTWRMMAMNLKRKEREQLALQSRYVSPFHPLQIPTGKSWASGSFHPAGLHKPIGQTRAPLRVASRSCACPTRIRTRTRTRTRTTT